MLCFGRCVTALQGMLELGAGEADHRVQAFPSKEESV